MKIVTGIRNERGPSFLPPSMEALIVVVDSVLVDGIVVAATSAYRLRDRALYPLGSTENGVRGVKSQVADALYRYHEERMQ